MGKTILRREKKRNNSSSSNSKPQQKSPQQTLVREISNPPVLPPSSRYQSMGTKCTRCDMGLCVVPCFPEIAQK